MEKGECIGPFIAKDLFTKWNRRSNSIHISMAEYLYVLYFATILANGTHNVNALLLLLVLPLYDKKTIFCACVKGEITTVKLLKLSSLAPAPLSLN